MNLDVMLARRKVRGVRFDTLAKICRVLECQPGDLLEFCDDGSDAPPA